MNFRKLAEEYYDGYLKDLNDLVSIESTRDSEHAAKGMPFGPAPRKALDTMLSIAERDGFDTHDYEGYAGTVSYGDGEETVGILGHLDIVPLGDGWTKNPLQVTRENGYLFGRGVLDDKGPTLAAYYALKMIKDAHIPLKRKVMLIAGCDEESGMECMDYYAKNGPIPDMGFTPDADFPVIYGEKGNIHLTLNAPAQQSVIQSFKGGLRPNIVIANAEAVVDADDFDQDLFDFYLKANDLKGKISNEEDGIHISMEGTPAHGAMPYLGNNAGVHLLHFIGLAYNDTLALDLYNLMKDWKGVPVGIYKEGLHMGFLTMNPGIIEIDRDGDKAYAMIDIRYPNDTTPEAVLKGFQDAVKEVESDITPVLESAGKPLFVDPNSKLVTDLMASYAKYTGDTFSPAITIGGGTYAKKFDNFVAFGPVKLTDDRKPECFVGGCHQRDEGIAEDDVLEAIAIYADAIVRLAS
jgi:succinyl-diaminopimelate desuccinylase